MSNKLKFFLGIAYLLKEAYEVFIFPEWVVTITLQWLPRWIRGLAFIIFAPYAWPITW